MQNADTEKPAHGNPLAMGPVEKLQFLRRAAAINSLSRVQLAILVVLADMANSRDGMAWPSFNYLAEATGTTPRHVKRAMLGLIQTGAVSIAMPGTRVRSNRYRLNHAAFGETMAEGGDAQGTTQAGGPTGTTMVSAKAICGDGQAQDMVACASPESIHKSEHQARIERIDTEGARAIAGGPGGPLRSAGQPGGDAYPEFWEAFGVRSTVALAEKRIRELLAAGVDYAAMVDGASRYGSYNLATGAKRRTSADRWLEREGWRDSWTVREYPDTDKGPREGTKRAVEARSRPVKGKGKRGPKPGTPGRKTNPVWKQLNDKHFARSKEARQATMLHFMGCVTCKGKHYYEELCEKGREVATQEQKQREEEAREMQGIPRFLPRE